MNKIILSGLMLIVLISSVSAEYQIDIIAKEINVSPSLLENISIHQLAYNVWRLNCSNPNNEGQRSQLMAQLFYKDGNSDWITNANSISKITTNSLKDINRRGYYGHSYTDTGGTITAPFEIHANLNINFTNQVNNTNCSSWSNLKTFTSTAMGVGATAKHYINETLLNNVASNGVNQRKLSYEIGKDKLTDEITNPLNAWLYSTVQATTSTNENGNSHSWAIYVCNSPISYSSDTKTVGGSSVSTVELIDYVTNSSYNVPAFSGSELIVSLYPQNPLNNSGINADTTIYYKLYNVNGLANCSFRVGGVTKSTTTGISNGTFNFTFVLSDGINGTNNLNISCVDYSNSATDIKTLIIDTKLPTINSIKYKIGDGNYLNLNNSDIYADNVTIEINTSDTNNYLFNITIINNATGLTQYSYEITGIGTNYSFNQNLALNSGTYTATITSKDYYGGYLNQKTEVVNFDFLLTKTNLSVTLYDSDTLNIINDTNITLQLVGALFQSQKTTDNGTAIFTFVFNSSAADSVSLSAFQTYDEDYSIITRVVSVTQGSDLHLNMYLTNTSNADKTKTVNFKVIDENSVNLEGAILKIYKRNPSTNQFLHLTDLTVNANGETNAKLILDTVFYKLIVDYNNKQVYVSGVYPVSTNDDQIKLNCVVGAGYTDSFLLIKGFSSTLTFIRTTNETGYYSFSYTSKNQVTVCLDTYYLINTVRFNTSYNCVTGKSGAFNSGIISSTQKAMTYGDLYLDFPDDYDTLSIYKRVVDVLGLDDSSRGNSGRLFIFLGFVMLAGVGFVFAPVVGLIIFSIGVLVIAATNFTLIGVTEAMFIVGLSVFVIITLVKNANK